MKRILHIAAIAAYVAAVGLGQSEIEEGELFVEVGRLHDAYWKYKSALERDVDSSLAHYRLAELYVLEKDYQSAEKEFQQCLNGDNEPPWTIVWAHIQLGKILDMRGLRESAIDHYRKAVETGDNTQNAREVARTYLKSRFRHATAIR